MPILAVVAGFVLLFLAGEALVRGSVALARRLGVSPLLIGLTLVGFGTSMPELVTSVDAALSGSPGIAVGNVVGSNIANILLVLGLAATLSPLACHAKAFRRDGTALALASLLGAALLWSGDIDRLAGVALVGCLLLYVIGTYRTERNNGSASAAVHAEEASAAEPVPAGTAVALAMTLGGIAGVVAGAHLLVGGAIELADRTGVSETLLGLTLVAVGTSLPELATTIIAAARRHADVAFGNIVGSNIFNILGVLGATVAIQPIPVPPEILRLDLWIMLVATALLIVFAVTGSRLTRAEGSVFLCGYAVYVALLAYGAS